MEFDIQYCLIKGVVIKICGRMKYLMRGKSGTKDSINHNFGEIRTDSQKSVQLKKQ